MIKPILIFNRYIYIFGVFFKNCLIGYMEYRANLAMEVISELAFIAVKIIYAVVIYNTQAAINGIPPAIVLVIGGNYMILTGIFVGFFMMNLLNITTHVRDGSMDMMITKPISLQFMVSLRRFQFGAAAPNIIGGIIMFSIGLQKLNAHIDLINIISYLILMVSAIILTYSIFLSIQLVSFWIVKAEALSGIFEMLWDYNNMPMSIYGAWVKRICIFAFPLLVISNFPVMSLLKRLEGSYMVWGIVAPVIFFILSRILWNTAIKNYSSASS